MCQEGCVHLAPLSVLFCYCWACMLHVPLSGRGMCHFMHKLGSEALLLIFRWEGVRLQQFRLHLFGTCISTSTNARHRAANSLHTPRSTPFQLSHCPEDHCTCWSIIGFYGASCYFAEHLVIFRLLCTRGHTPHFALRLFCVLFT